MEHVAIMKKSWDLTKRIISGQKKIESRWYKSKRAPWNKICARESVYFKNSGEPITIKSEVDKVIQLSDLNPKQVKNILHKYCKSLGIENKKIPEFFEMFKNKKYCILIFIKNSKKIKSFEIDKTGFGMMSSWISVENINKIKKNMDDS